MNEPTLPPALAEFFKKNMPVAPGLSTRHGAATVAFVAKKPGPAHYSQSALWASLSTARQDDMSLSLPETNVIVSQLLLGALTDRAAIPLVCETLHGLLLASEDPVMLLENFEVAMKEKNAPLATEATHQYFRHLDTEPTVAVNAPIYLAYSQLVAGKLIEADIPSSFLKSAEDLERRMYNKAAMADPDHPSVIAHGILRRLDEPGYDIIAARHVLAELEEKHPDNKHVDLVFDAIENLIEMQAERYEEPDPVLADTLKIQDVTLLQPDSTPPELVVEDLAEKETETALADTSADPASFRHGQEALKKKNFGAAIDLFTAYLADNPRHHFARIRLSQALRGAGRHDDALAEAQKCCEDVHARDLARRRCFPHYKMRYDTTALAELARCFIAVGEDGEAEQALKVILTQTPQDNGSRLLLAGIYQRAAEKADEVAQKTIMHEKSATLLMQINKNAYATPRTIAAEMFAHMHLVELHVAQGNTHSARTNLQRNEELSAANKKLAMGSPSINYCAAFALVQRFRMDGHSAHNYFRYDDLQRDIYALTRPLVVGEAKKGRFRPNNRGRYTLFYNASVWVNREEDALCHNLISHLPYMKRLRRDHKYKPKPTTDAQPLAEFLKGASLLKPPAAALG